MNRPTRIRLLTLSSLIAVALFIVSWSISPTRVAAQEQALWLASGSNISNTNSGNVGIGTNSPTEKLHLLGNIKLGDDSVPSPYWLSLTSAGNGIKSGIRFGTNSSPALRWAIYGHSSDDKLHVDMAGAEKLTVDSSGNLGIGTTNPQKKLHVGAAKLLVTLDSRC